MKTAVIPEKAARLRAQHPTFRYERFSIAPVAGGLRLDYLFSIEPNLKFSPHVIIPICEDRVVDRIQRDPLVQRLAFLIGMVELLSYWKSCCPARIEILAGSLSDDEIPFWDSLIRKGLGEFFFTNEIPPTLEFSIIADKTPWDRPLDRSPVATSHSPSYLVLIGGGKDSVVTLELLRELSETAGACITPFALNPIPASLESVRAAKHSHPLVAERSIDPALRDLNSKGYLNGHTPFSALLTFVSTLTAYINGHSCVLASNEASASEGNVEFHGLQVNHQYSKSYEFEQLVREYLSNLPVPVEYASFLRPLNELQICGLFSELTHQHPVFRSCNREQTLAARTRETVAGSSQTGLARHGWCADCPKCVFTYLCLSCFLSEGQLEEIFGVDVSAQPHFSSLAVELAGFSHHKPFECVGTYEEVQTCLMHLLDRKDRSHSLSAALNNLRPQLQLANPPPLQTLLSRWNAQHFLCPSLESLLRRALEGVQQRARA